MKAITKVGTNLKYVQSESLRNDPEIALAAITQTTRACKYIGDELKSDKEFVTDTLRKLIALKRNQTYQQPVIDVGAEPKRAKVSKYSYAIPRSWPGNVSSLSELGEGTLGLPFGTDIGEETEEKCMEIISLHPYAGQLHIIEAIDETILHDPEVKSLIFELDCVALLFNDMHRKEMLSSDSEISAKSGPLRDRSTRIFDEWDRNYKTEPLGFKRIQSWPTKFCQPKDDSELAIADNIHFWIECVIRTKNPRLLAEAPMDILADEDKMLEAIAMDIELFQVSPWKLRVAETFKAKLESAFPDRFLWITLGDSRAEIPSKARDSEISEMITAFAEVQKRTGLLQHEVPFLQLSM
jgi:hypothetical protein